MKIGIDVFGNLRKKEKTEKILREYFDVFNAYTPSFSTFEGGLYEMELTRAAVHSFATHVSKLKPEVAGANNKAFERRLQFKPNPLMDTKKYLYRLATIVMVDNNAIIAPVENDLGDLVGFYPMTPEKLRIVDVDGIKYVRYDLGNGKYYASEFVRCGLMNQFQFKDEIWGATNTALKPTLSLLHTQNEGIVEGIKSAANLRFMARLGQVLRKEDIEKERKNFVESNLSASNNGGVLMFDQKYADVKQINSTPYVVDDKQMNLIKENVFDYFGTNEKIMQNKFTSDEWNAYYEGKIEPFAIEASLVHTNMAFTEHEIAFGNQIMFTANRLQYMSNQEKLNTITQLFDRGFLTHNQGLEIMNMSSVENGDKRYIRKEYAFAENSTELNEVEE